MFEVLMQKIKSLHVKYELLEANGIQIEQIIDSAGELKDLLMELFQVPDDESVNHDEKGKLQINEAGYCRDSIISILNLYIMDKVSLVVCYKTFLASLDEFNGINDSNSSG